MKHGDGKRMVIVLDCCVGCHACEIACRQEHDLSAETGAKWCRVTTVKPRKVKGELHLDFFPTMWMAQLPRRPALRTRPMRIWLLWRDGMALSWPRWTMNY